MQITSENGFKNALEVLAKTSHEPKLWSFPLYVVFRGGAFHMSSELIFMFLDSKGPGERWQLQSYIKIKLFLLFGR